MVKKPTYEELEQRIKELEKEALKHKHAEEALEEKAQFYSAILDHAGFSIVLIDAETEKRVAFNTKEHESHGYTREEYQNIKSTGSSAGIDIVDNEENGHERAKRIIEKGSEIFETKHRTKSGKIIDVLTSSVAIRLKKRDHLLNISHDITERKESEEALLKSEKRFRDLAELLPETIFEMDLYGHLTFVSRSAFAQFKYTPEDFEKGLTAFDMIAPDDRERAMNNVRKIIKGEDLGLQEYSALRKDGTTFPAFFHSAVIISDGKPVGLRGFVIDISERKKVEVKLKESESKYQDLYEHAPDMFVSVDTKTAVIIECNQTLADNLGYTKKEIIDH